jgi:MATE family multidrug resistance protein
VTDLAVNTEVVFNCSATVISAIFQISDGIQVVVLGALRGLQDVKIPMYITFIAYCSWFSSFNLFRNVYGLEGRNMDWSLAGLSTWLRYFCTFDLIA